MHANTARKIRAAVALAVLSAVSGHVLAESGTSTNAPFSVANRVDFSLVIPAVLYFRVGTDAAATIDVITFSPAAANVGDSSVIAGVGGDATGGKVNVTVRGNHGQVTIATTVASANGLGTGVPADGFVSYGEIATSSSDANVPAPTLANAGIANVNVLLNSNKSTNRTAVWTYTYANSTTPTAGTYSGRATYTATML